ncbi:unnamed protein product [Orchesella dallaii]|uniref:Uncharacterized protein n=1 Tax=Orchesella dallaii TaxID=48710 RepID=A0ABP1S1T8_9HEXA
MKVLFIALAICAIAFANTAEKDKAAEKPVDKAAENKTVTADKPADKDKHTRDARYLLLDNGGLYDRRSDYVVPNVVVSRSRNYVVESPSRNILYY